MESTAPNSASHTCNWFERAEKYAGTPYLLHNAAACLGLSSPQAAAGRLRSCFDSVESLCLDRGVILAGTACTCDAGYSMQGNAPNGIYLNGTNIAPPGVNMACEHFKYSRSLHTTDQFAAANSAQCSATYRDPPPSLPDYVSEYCTNTSLICQNQLSIGHLPWGGCHSAAQADAGRFGATLGRILPAVYPNGINNSVLVNRANFTAIFHNLYPVSNYGLSHNDVFRAVGLMLQRDILQADRITPPCVLNIAGARTGKSTSNPAQFNNSATGWIDLSPLYGVPQNLNPTVANIAILNAANQNVFSVGSLTARYFDMTPQEISLLHLLASRHNKLYNALAPFTGNNAALNNVGGACARELLLEEWRNIATEFIADAKCFFKEPVHDDYETLKFPFDEQGIVPVEATAAQIFNLHHQPQACEAKCNEQQGLDAGYDRSCLVASTSNPLQRQINLDSLSNAEFSKFTRAEMFGLGSVDDYVTKLGKPWDYHRVLYPHLNLGLQGSKANYAINFGFIENLLLEQKSLRNATASCLAFAATIDQTTVNTMAAFMPGGGSAIERLLNLTAVINSVGFGGMARQEIFRSALGLCN